ncbi:DNA-3-methyladenine glycosylase I [Methylomarinum vadi]|uniref:DNA-3-methyladenine glycosylase I n=1 Tax=Methylomarinum vadi TaxID=438855 RepID=UPI0004DF50B3|nr:DNA-3-methyladenine glycosylase I [Methylomarinum vadi]
MAKCPWALASKLEEHYHDHEWGVPVHDDRLLFEFLILEGAQAGLSWRTVLAKREAYRDAFDGFDVATVAAYDEERLQRLLQNPNLIRNRLKLQAAIGNAQAFLRVQQRFGSFDQFIWQFVDGNPVQNRWQRMEEVPATTPESKDMSRALKGLGFKFVGPTICYAFMQAVGMVNDHVLSCYRHDQLAPEKS